jgi:hypothetical protein
MDISIERLERKLVTCVDLYPTWHGTASRLFLDLTSCVIAPNRSTTPDRNEESIGVYEQVRFTWTKKPPSAQGADKLTRSGLERSRCGGGRLRVFLNRQGGLPISFGHRKEVLSVTHLRQLMIEELRRRDFAESTIRALLQSFGGPVKMGLHTSGAGHVRFQVASF